MHIRASIALAFVLAALSPTAASAQLRGGPIGMPLEGSTAPLVALLALVVLVNWWGRRRWR
jgi:hypothetical protein